MDKEYVRNETITYKPEQSYEKSLTKATNELMFSIFRGDCKKTE